MNSVESVVTESGETLRVGDEIRTDFDPVGEQNINGYLTVNAIWESETGGHVSLCFGNSTTHGQSYDYESGRTIISRKIIKGIRRKNINWKQELLSLTRS